MGVNVDRSRVAGSDCDDVMLGELVARVCEMGEGVSEMVLIACVVSLHIKR